MYIERRQVDLTTNAAGDVTGYTPVVTGRILAIVYVKDDFDAGVDFTITVEKTGEQVWTEENVDVSKTVYPHIAAHDNAGVGVTFDGTNEIYVPISVANDRIKIVVAAGGNAKSGTFHVIVG